MMEQREQERSGLNAKRKEAILDLSRDPRLNGEAAYINNDPGKRSLR